VNTLCNSCGWKAWAASAKASLCDSKQQL